MASTEYRFITLRTPAERIVPPRDGGITSLTVDFLGSVPELAEHMDGWEAVNFQVAFVDQSAVLVVLLRTQMGTVAK